MLKDLLCVVEAGEKPSAALAQAAALVSGYNAEAHYIAAVPGPPPLVNLFGTDLVEDLIYRAKAQAAEAAERLRAQITERSRQYGREAQVTCDSRSLAEITAAVEGAARSRDLTVLARPDSFLNASSAIFETALFGSGRPVMLANPDKEPVTRFGTAVLAWDGSAPASRATACALSLFPNLKEIFVLTIVGEKKLDDLVPGADIAAHIRRHGIQATVACVDLDVGEENAGPSIDRFARGKNADLLVMGGYGRSRLREFVLGGVTEYLSKRATVPLLLAH